MTFPQKKHLDVHRQVCSEGVSMKLLASRYGVSKPTIQKWLDIVTEFNCSEFNITLKGDELLEVLGWLRNGNYTSGELADRIEQETRK